MWRKTFDIKKWTVFVNDVLPTQTEKKKNSYSSYSISSPGHSHACPVARIWMAVSTQVKRGRSCFASNQHIYKAECGLFQISWPRVPYAYALSKNKSNSDLPRSSLLPRLSNWMFQFFKMRLVIFAAILAGTYGKPIWYFCFRKLQWL